MKTAFEERAEQIISPQQIDAIIRNYGGKRLYIADAYSIRLARLSRRASDTFLAHFRRETIYIPKRSSFYKKELVRELHKAGKTNRDIATFTHLSVEHVTRILGKKAKKSG
ncbi:MAG: hypothetical protein K0U36_06855 [Alphaproteobacteria bacterium]|nr:hypothetical protein [Alphaproteobacteria bacterium]